MISSSLDLENNNKKEVSQQYSFARSNVGSSNTYSVPIHRNKTVELSVRLRGTEYYSSVGLSG